VRYRGIFAILSRCAMLRNCWKSAVSMSITQPSDAGCRITARSWSSDCDGAKKQVGTLLADFGYSVIDLGNLRDGGLIQQAGGSLDGRNLLEVGERYK
jgi:predicted dinucleotide-binding enzyme